MSFNFLYSAKALFGGSVGIKVSDEATITFDLSVSYTERGPSMHYQAVTSYRLQNDSDHNFITCTNDMCYINDDDDHHWWTIHEPRYIFVLHQAKSTDRGKYKAIVETEDPANNHNIMSERIFFVTCELVIVPKPCQFCD